jgi:hypothetical protein
MKLKLQKRVLNRLETTYVVLKRCHNKRYLKVVTNYKITKLHCGAGAKPALKFLAPSELKLRPAELYARSSLEGAGKGRLWRKGSRKGVD